MVKLKFYKHEVNPGDVVKVRVHLKPDQYADWPHIQEAVRKWGEDNGLHVHIVQPVTEQTRSKSQTRKQLAPKTDNQILQSYAKQRGIDEKTQQTGLSLMESV